MNLIKKSIPNGIITNSEIALEIDVPCFLKGAWFTPYAKGMGLETQIKAHKSSIQVRTGFTKEATTFLTLFLSLTLVLSLMSLLAWRRIEPETFSWNIASLAMLLGILVLSLFGFWIVFLATQQNMAVENVVKRELSK